MNQRASRKGKSIRVKVNDLYQLLIGDCRYGYTRNNHLMPWGAFEHCKKYLPIVKEVDPICAAHTASQLADEAIQELTRDALDDDKKKFFFLQEGIADEKREIHAEWEPGVGEFEASVIFLGAPGITFSLPSGEKILSLVESEGKLLVKYEEDEAKYPREFRYRLYEEDKCVPNLFNSVSHWSNQDNVIEKDRRLLFLMSRDKRSLDVNMYEEFIDFCVDFAKNAGGYPPYNYEDYEEFLRTHPKPSKD